MRFLTSIAPAVAVAAALISCVGDVWAMPTVQVSPVAHQQHQPSVVPPPAFPQMMDRVLMQRRGRRQADTQLVEALTVLAADSAGQPVPAPGYVPTKPLSPPPSSFDQAPIAVPLPADVATMYPGNTAAQPVPPPFDPSTMQAVALPADNSPLFPGQNPAPVAVITDVSQSVPPAVSAPAGDTTTQQPAAAPDTPASAGDTTTQQQSGNPLMGGQVLPPTVLITDASQTVANSIQNNAGNLPQLQTVTVLNGDDATTMTKLVPPDTSAPVPIPVLNVVAPNAELAFKPAPMVRPPFFSAGAPSFGFGGQAVDGQAPLSASADQWAQRFREWWAQHAELQQQQDGEHDAPVQAPSTPSESSDSQTPSGSSDS